MNEIHGLSDDLIRRLPQRVQLSSGRWKRRLQATLALSAVGVPMLASWHLWSLHPEWRVLLIVGSASWLGLHLLAGQALSWIVEPLLAARGLLPNVEYLPQDDQVILTDLGGFDALFRPEARVIFYLASLSAIRLHERQTDTHRFWEVAIRTRKGDEYPITASGRDTRDQALEIGQRLAAMLNLPLE